MPKSARTLTLMQAVSAPSTQSAALQHTTLAPKKTRSHRDANGLILNPQMSPHFQ
jgi:hypothetical protein